MKKRFEDRISSLPLPAAAGDTPAVASIEPGREGWKLTRRDLLGLLALGGVVGYSSTAAASPCAPGAFAHTVLLDSLSFFPDGETLISAGRDSFVKFWSLPSGALFRSLATDHIPLQVAVSPNGTQIAVAMETGELQLWQADGGNRRTLPGHKASVNGVAFTPDGSQLVSVSNDGATSVWSVATGALRRSFMDTAEAQLQVAVPSLPAPSAPAPQQERHLAAPVAPRPYFVTSGGQVYLRLLSTGAVIRTVPGKAFAISRDSAFLAAHDGTRLSIYAFPSLSPLVSVVEKRAPGSLAFSVDGKLLAVAYTDNPARLYSSPDLTLLREMEANDGSCLAAAMDPQNAFLAVASGRSLRLYNLPAGNRVSVCFMDLAASAPGCSGTQYFWGGIGYMGSCGTAVPFGAVCSCDCVPGACSCVSDVGCSCDTDSGCSCDSNNPCSCNSDTGCSCVGDIGCSCDSDYGCGCVDDWGCGCEGDFGWGGCGCDSDFGWGGGSCGCDGDFGWGGGGGCGCDGD